MVKLKEEPQTSFLGEKIVSRRKLSDIPNIDKTIKSINGYAIRSEASNSEALKIDSLYCAGLDESTGAIELTSGRIFYPLSVVLEISLGKSLMLKRPLSKTLDLCQAIYINTFGRPNNQHLMTKLSQILKGERLSEVESGRYVFCMNKIPHILANHFLDIAKKGDGQIIDYTWISSFQDIVEQHEDDDVERKTQKLKGRGMYGVSRRRKEEVGIMELEEIEDHQDLSEDEIVQQPNMETIERIQKLIGSRVVRVKEPRSGELPLATYTWDTHRTFFTNEWRLKS